MRVTAFLLAAGLLLASATFSQSVGAPQNDYLVVPGQRVGPWELGRPLEAYQWGRPRSTWRFRDPATEIHIVDAYNYLAGPSGPSLIVNTCRDHPRVIQILIHRWTTLPPEIESEAFKFKTIDGIGLGSDETDIMRVLGRPTYTREWIERHDTTDISAVGYSYLPPGIAFLVNRGNKKVFGLGAELVGGWSECYLAAFGARTATLRQDLTSPGPSGVPLPRNLRVIPPEKDIPDRYAALSGAWVGVNKYGTPHVLVVEEILLNPPRSIVVFAWGGRFPRWQRYVARFTAEDLTLLLGDLTTLYRFRLASEDKLEVRLDLDGEPTFLLSRVKN